MTTLPAPRAAARTPHRSPAVRHLAHRLLRPRAFIRQLALADHQGSGGY